MKPLSSDDDSDRGSDVCGTLSVISDITDGVPGPQQQKLYRSGSSPQPPAFIPPVRLPIPGTPVEPPMKSSSLVNMHPKNQTSVSNEDPQALVLVDEVYENFSLEHGLDDAVIGDSSSRTSTMDTEALHPFATLDRQKVKSSTRVIADEHRQRLGSAVPRKRTTEVWESKVEDVAPERVRSTFLARHIKSPMPTPTTDTPAPPVLEVTLLRSLSDACLPDTRKRRTRRRLWNRNRRNLRTL